MVTLRITKENFDQLIGMYFKVCGLLDPDVDVSVLDASVNSDGVEFTVNTTKNLETLN